MPGNWHVRFLGGVSYPVRQFKKTKYLALKQQYDKGRIGYKID